MSFTDEHLKRLKDNVRAAKERDEIQKVVSHVVLMTDAAAALIARLEAAERVCLETCRLHDVTEKLTNLYDAWLEAAGK